MRVAGGREGWASPWKKPGLTDGSPDGGTPAPWATPAACSAAAEGRQSRMINGLESSGGLVLRGKAGGKFPRGAFLENNVRTLLTLRWLPQREQPTGSVPRVWSDYDCTVAAGADTPEQHTAAERCNAPRRYDTLARPLEAGICAECCLLNV
jgi:hypothetical protein